MSTTDDEKTITYDNNDVFIGEKNEMGEPHGKGTYTHHNKGQVRQGTYAGEWKDGIKDGKGTYHYSNGDIYEGPWKDDKRHGSNGKYTYYKNPSSVYKGDWKDDMKHGSGIMEFANGDKYVGDWKKNKMEANEATYTWKDGTKYVGPFVNDKKHGKGKLIYANGDKYEGDFTDGKRTGQGEYIHHGSTGTQETSKNEKQAKHKSVRKKQTEKKTTADQYDDPADMKSNGTDETDNY